MKKCIYITALFVLGPVMLVFSQSFNSRSIFNSGVTAGIEFLPNSGVNDSLDFQLTKYKLQFVKVLRTKEVDLEEFDYDNKEAKANQMFLSSRFSVARPTYSTNNTFKPIFNAEFELTYLSASWKRGVWIHAVNVSASESQDTYLLHLSPNFRAYSIYVHVSNLDFVPFVGPGLTIFQGRFFPVPVVGFRAKIMPDLYGELIVPVHVKLRYSIRNVDLELATYYSAINAIYREGSTYKDNDNTLNLQQLKSYIGITAEPVCFYKFKLELGYAFFQEIDALSSDYFERLEPMPFVNLSFNYNFGNSILYNYFNQGRSKKNKSRECK